MKLNRKRTQRLTLRLTPNEKDILEAKTKASGFGHQNDYIRSVLFLGISVTDKIDQIYHKVMEK